jgi:hypothetical protein
LQSISAFIEGSVAEKAAGWQARLAASKAPKLLTVFADNVLSINASFQLTRRKISHSRFVFAAAKSESRRLALLPNWAFAKPGST